MRTESVPYLIRASPFAMGQGTIQPGFDLVYIDTPYVNRAGVGVDYRDFYHFLEGMMLSG